MSTDQRILIGFKSWSPIASVWRTKAACMRVMQVRRAVAAIIG